MSTNKAEKTEITCAKAINTKGQFVRKDSVFRNWIKADGSTNYQPELRRYHLYVSRACPWCDRVTLILNLKGLQHVISVDVVSWHLSSAGWHFDEKLPGCTKESVHGSEYIREVYVKAAEKANQEFDGRCTVPILYDRKTDTIVNNESSEIIRMFNYEFNEFAKNPELDLYPKELRSEIDEINSWIYPMLNNGVYRSGFARSQEAYDEAVREVFQALDKMENILSTKRFLTGSRLTEADIRAFVTLFRFDPVYHLHFKCNKKRIIDYPNIWGFVRDIYNMPGISDTVNLEHIVKHYHVSHTTINPFSIVPINPDLDYSSLTGRENM